MYIDCCLYCNNPIKQCLEDNNNIDHILSFNLLNTERNDSFDKINLFEFIQNILINIIGKVQKFNNIKTPYQIIVALNNVANQPWIKCIEDSDYRKLLIEEGIKYGRLFLNYKTS